MDEDPEDGHSLINENGVEIVVTPTTIAGDNEYESTAESLDAYFLPFSYLSLRAGRAR